MAADTPPLKPKERKKGGNVLTKVHIPYKEREYFTTNLALLLKSAVPINEALDSLATTARSKGMRSGIETLRVDIEAGYPLADALDRANLCGSQTLSLVRLGEESGHLIENLELAAQQEEKRHVFKSKVRSALIYPAFVLSLTLIVGLGVAWFLLPRLSATFSQLKVQLPFISRAMINFGLFLKDYGKIVVPLTLLLLGIAVYVLFFAPKTKFMGQRILLVIPGIGRLLREVEIAQFGYLLGTLLDAGLPITQAVNLLGSASTSPPYQAFYKYLAKSFDEGYTFKDSLNRYKGSQKILPAAVQQMIIAGEHSGSLSEVLHTIGRTYEQKADITTANLEAIIEPIMLIVVWLGVMLVAVAVIVPIYSLVGGLN